MKEVYLIRHGETEWNKTEIFRGRRDIPLNERGFKQARAISDALKGKTIGKIYSSPLQRSIQTAIEIADPRGLNITTDDGFTDFDYGEWEGLSLAEVGTKFPKLCEQWEIAPHTVFVPGGESLALARDRATNALNSILGDSEDNVILIVTHRVICKLLILELLSLPNDRFWQIRQDNACMNRLDMAGSIKGGIVISLNDTCHLNGIDGGPISRDF